MALLPSSTILNFLGFHPSGDLGPLTMYTSRRNKMVAYLKSPPKEPPTYYQIRQRNRFRLAGAAWTALPPATRQEWNTAANRTGAAITGYNLFTYYQLTHDRAAILTIEHQTGTQLIP